jgi:hypothetical protein
MRRPRVLNVVWLAAMLVAAGVTYKMKYEAEAAAGSVAKLQSEIAAEKDKIRTLTAEWAFLNQPARLEAVAKEHAGYFQLAPFSPSQLATIDEIPMRAVPGAVPASAPASGGPGSSPDAVAVQATLARIAAGGALRQR